jgi:hypothetical protein
MKGGYRFLRTREGITGFAKVEVSSRPSDKWAISWSVGLDEQMAIYGETVTEAVMAAAAGHERLGGGRHSVQVDLLIESAVDTKADAVFCAAAIAAWKSWGRAEEDVSIAYVNGRWRVEFPP